MSSEFVLYKWLGGLNIALLISIIGLTIWALAFRHRRRVAFLICGGTLVLLISVSVFCMAIYAEYHSSYPR